MVFAEIHVKEGGKERNKLLLGNSSPSLPPSKKKWSFSEWDIKSYWKVRSMFPSCIVKRDFEVSIGLNLLCSIFRVAENEVFCIENSLCCEKFGISTMVGKFQIK
ncbi:hypothetical protein TNIN_237631 [Trichonephila inaurata madagascariensis]|uniref:Uncharacterized protein n=1 Tax=Trichonephila inaurata madagascariensis TaxID=2747483 RepID=A0A8X6MLV5_9ARAC|nr:hypothetical protein TNIN_237631 [Trichonephila inaurata madagascariensis]